MAVAVLPLLWTLAMIVSEDARRATCREGRLRSVCTTLGIGPTPAENALWARATTLRSGDGLREYLNAYPSGAFVDEAHARLDACAHEEIEALGRIDERRYAGWRVSPRPAHAFVSEDQARGDALQRGNDDARSSCGALGITDSLISATFELKTPSCSKQDDGFVCGLTGDLICRVQRKVRTPVERCNGYG